jgi:hypothetical protein
VFDFDTQEGTAFLVTELIEGVTLDNKLAAGVVLYELATGRRPFEGQSTTALADEILHAAAPSPQVLQP